jgi:CubicO group peptidase (beta-lactamase class C family)
MRHLPPSSGCAAVHLEPGALTTALPVPASRRPFLSDKLRRDLDPWLGERAKSGAFSGVVLVAKNGTPVYSAAFGQADRERNVPNTIDTPFNLGSANKMWTAIAIAQLVERGKVDLDATVGRYVPDLPNQTIRETVKIRHLLSHSSGMRVVLPQGLPARQNVRGDRS